MLKGGFRAFVRKRDGLPLTSVSKVTGVQIEYLYNVVKHKVEYDLIRSFDWSSTPQEECYWLHRHAGRLPLSSEDYRWLEELYDYNANKEI